MDISNAFNSCDRAAMLQKLYATPQLAPLYRIADFGYSAPHSCFYSAAAMASRTILNPTTGRQVKATRWRLLFCLYMRDVYEAVANRS